MSIETNVQATEAFLRESFDKSEYYTSHPDEKAYRLEHSYRVANIGRQIALAEGMNAETLTIACLLHDISYRDTFNGHEDMVNHGRAAAKIARPFLVSLGYSEQDINNICYGIAIHVDDKADFDGERNSFALSVGDADNIDRFDAYRIFETLKWVKYDEIDIGAKSEYVNRILGNLEKNKEIKFATQTADRMWKERIEFKTAFFEKLKNQIIFSSLSY